MATVQDQRPAFQAADIDRRVRHPLHALKGYIRSYVLFEGLAVAVIYLAVCFWAGLALDFGSFKLFAFDWIQELQALTTDEKTGAPSNVVFIMRLTLLGVFLAGLIGLVAWKVLFRITREFRDAALALVLERRFPRELGDRLITAVEMADPKLSEKFGYSRVLIEHTIQDAADRVEKVPVKEVFNWTRLYRLGLWSGLLTMGVYLLAGIGACVAGAVSGEVLSPFDFMWRFNDVAGIWTERNILLMDSYWPRGAYLEVVRFQDTPAHPGEMLVPSARDEQRADIQVRAIQWVIADRKSPDGWRALRWRDLDQFLDKSMLAAVAIPRDWDKWTIDIDDLDPNIPAGVVPPSWQGKSAGDIRQEHKNASLQETLKKAKAEKAVAELLDWHAWTLDRIQLQEQKGEIRRAMREEFPQARKALEDILGKLAALADSARYSRTLRRLEIPENVVVYYRGATTKNNYTHPRQNDYKYALGLGDLKESVRFTVQGEDYYTPYKKITLVPPPSIKAMTVDKEEPAYIYYRLQGDQSPLKGKKQIFTRYPIGIMGDASAVQVPLGTNLVLRAETDRKLKDGIRMRAPDRSDERGALVPDVPVVLGPGGTHFSLALKKIVKTHEFILEYHDEDNVKGRRRIKIQPSDDRPPEVFDFELEVVLRKPRFQAVAGRATQGTAADGFLITPDALLPFKGTLRDDYGLTKAAWAYEVEQVEFELVGQGLEGKKDKNKLPTLVLQGSSRTRRAAIIATSFQFYPGNPAMVVGGPYSLMAELLKIDLAQKRSEGEEFKDLEGFLRALELRSLDELPLNTLAKALAEKPAGRPLLKEHLLKDEEGFDLKRHLPRLKVLDPQREAQLHYLVKINVVATDNNVETGPNSGRNKAPFTFLVVSENELLGQVGIEEETLRDRLEKADYKLRIAKTSIDDQIGKLAMTGAEYSLVSIRVEEIRKALLDAATIAREVHTDYRRILKELEVNRVRKDKIRATEERIVVPLGEIVEPNNGNFATTEQAFDKLYQLLDEDILLKRGEENRSLHLENAKAGKVQLERLIERLFDVLKAMDEGVVFSKQLEIIVNLEREQRQIAEYVRFMREELIRITINELTQPKEKR